MTPQAPLPRPARWLLQLSPLPRERRAEVQADLHELFVVRRGARGAVHAHWRLYHDLASLWLRSRPAASPTMPGSTLRFLRDIRGDLRYAVRLFARQRAILLLTVIGLSLGLGIATAAFSIMNAAVVRGEGLVDPDRAPGVLRISGRSTATAWTYDEFLHLREGSTLMHLEAVLTDAAIVRMTRGEAEAPSAGLAFVSGGFFAASGGRVTLGRPLDAADEQHPSRAGPPPVVVSFVFWTSRLDGDPAVVGRSILIGRTAATIVGVAERGFSVPHNSQLWIPLATYGAVYGAGLGVPVRGGMGVQVFGRLLPDVSLVEATAQLNAVAAALPPDLAAGGSPLKARLDPHAGLGRLPSSETLPIMVTVSAVIGLVLLLASANVATVLISTAITREREMGVRAALGASRGRIVRQLLTESLALGVVAAAIGLLFASWAVPLIGRMIEAPAGADLAPDLNVYLFLGIVTLVTGVGAGLAPAWHGRGVDLLTPLKGEGARQTRLAPRRLRSTLVITQAAVSVLLIVMATLFVRASFHAATIDVGFDAAGLYEVSARLGRDAFDEGGTERPGEPRANMDRPAEGAVNPKPEASREGSAGIRSFWARALAELQAVPGIAAVTLAELTPFDGVTKTSITRDTPPRRVGLNRTGAGYFETLGLRVLTGRTYTRDDVAAKAPVAVISESLARAYWPDRSPLGQMLPQQIPMPPSMATGPGGASLVPSTRPVIIGVVADAITARLHQRNTLAIYEPLDPTSEVFARLMIRVAPGATGVIQLANERLRSIDAQADIRIESVAARLQQEAGRPRMLATMTGVVGLVAIVLCVIGLYGLTAAVVGQRSREMGVRVAMGAAPRDLLQLLMWDSLRPVVFGLAIGAGAAFLASRLVVAAMFFGMSPQDPMAFAGAAVILLVAAVLAVLVPTRRAAAVDAAFVLRQS